jgi:hypothetical protein
MNALLEVIIAEFMVVTLQFTQSVTLPMYNLFPLSVTSALVKLL